MQSIALRQIDRGHTDPSTAGVTAVVLLYGMAPELPRLLGTALVESDVNQEVAVFKIWLEVCR